MKKIITFLMALSFCAAVNAQENVPAQTEGVTGIWAKTKDKAGELYVKIKDNKYAKYGVIGTGVALTAATGVGLYYKTRKKRGN